MSSCGDEPVIRWPFSITASTNDIRFEDGLGASTVKTIPAGTYINSSDGGAAPADFIAALETAFNQASVTLGLFSTWTVSIREETLLVVIRRGAGGANIDINWGHAETTLDPYLVGQFGETGVSTYTFIALFDSPFQAGNQWAPGIYALFDSAEQQRTITYEHRNLNGRPIRVNHNATAWVERLLDFSTPGIAAARMLDGRADEASYATVAEISTGEQNTWEKLKRYLVGAPNAYGDHRIYVYTTSDPTTHVQEGPYEYVLGDSSPGLAGVDLGDYVSERSSEYYPARVVLWGES